MYTQPGSDTAPQIMYASMAFSYLGAMLASNHALQFVSYPTQVRVNRKRNFFCELQLLCAPPQMEIVTVYVQYVAILDLTVFGFVKSRLFLLGFCREALVN